MAHARGGAEMAATAAVGGSVRPAATYTFVNDSVVHDELLACLLCDNVLLDPVIHTRCGRMFCRQCVHEGVGKCPACGDVYAARCLEEVSKDTARLLEELLVVCPHNSEHQFTRALMHVHLHGGPCDDDTITNANEASGSTSEGEIGGDDGDGDGAASSDAALLVASLRQRLQQTEERRAAELAAATRDKQVLQSALDELGGRYEAMLLEYATELQKSSGGDGGGGSGGGGVAEAAVDTAALTRLRREHEELQAQFAAERSRADRLETRVSSLTDEVVALQVELNEHAAAAAATTTTDAGEDTDGDGAGVGEVAALRSRLAAAETRLADKDAALGEYVRKYTVLERESAEMRDRYDELRRKTPQLTRRLRSSEDVSKRLTAENQRLSVSNSELQSLVLRAEQHHAEAAEAAAAATAGAVAEMRESTEIAALRLHSSNIIDQLDAVTRENEAIRQRNEQLNREKAAEEQRASAAREKLVRVQRQLTATKGQFKSFKRTLTKRDTAQLAPRLAHADGKRKSQIQGSIIEAVVFVPRIIAGVDTEVATASDVGGSVTHVHASSMTVQLLLDATVGECKNRVWSELVTRLEAPPALHWRTHHTATRDIVTNYQDELLGALGSCLSPADFEAAAKALFSLYDGGAESARLVTHAFSGAIHRSDVASVFDANFVSTQLLAVFCRVFGFARRKEVLSRFVKRVVEMKVSFELDPANLLPDEDVAANIANVEKVCALAFESLVDTPFELPECVRLLLHDLHAMVAAHYDGEAADRAVNAIVFREYIGAGLRDVDGAGLVSDYVRLLMSEENATCFAVVADSLQHYMEGTRFTAAHLQPLNAFIERATLERAFTFESFAKNYTGDATASVSDGEGEGGKQSAAPSDEEVLHTLEQLQAVLRRNRKPLRDMLTYNAALSERLAWLLDVTLDVRRGFTLKIFETDLAPDEGMPLRQLPYMASVLSGLGKGRHDIVCFELVPEPEFQRRKQQAGVISAMLSQCSMAWDVGRREEFNFRRTFYSRDPQCTGNLPPYTAASVESTSFPPSLRKEFLIKVSNYSIEPAQDGDDGGDGGAGTGRVMKTLKVTSEDVVADVLDKFRQKCAMLPVFDVATLDNCTLRFVGFNEYLPLDAKLGQLVLVRKFLKLKTRFSFVILPLAATRARTSYCSLDLMFPSLQPQCAHLFHEQSDDVLKLAEVADTFEVQISRFTASQGKDGGGGGGGGDGDGGIGGPNVNLSVECVLMHGSQMLGEKNTATHSIPQTPRTHEGGSGSSISAGGDGGGGNSGGGSSIMRQPTATLSSPNGDAETATFDWNQTLKLPIALKNLPRDAYMRFTLYGDDTSKRKAPRTVLGMALYHVFDHRAFMRMRTQRLVVTVDFDNQAIVGTLDIKLPQFVKPVLFAPVTASRERKQTQMRRFPSKEELDYLDSLLRKDSLCVLTEGDMQLLWNYRELCKTKPTGLAKVLRSVAWDKPLEVREAYRLLRQWEPLSAMQALELLDVKFADSYVRSYAVNRLKVLTDEQLSMILPELIQSLKNETYYYNDLFEFLLERCLNCRGRLGVQFFWALYCELPNHKCRARFKCYAEAYLRGCGAGQADEFIEQLKLVNFFKAISAKTKELPYGEPRNNVLRAELERYRLPAGGMHLPLLTSCAVAGFNTARCRVLDSFQAPLFLEFSRAETDAEPIRVIFKAGDDLRQDILSLQSMALINALWEKHGSLYLHLTPYEVVATSATSGFIEVVPDSETIATIQGRAGLRGPLKEEPISMWLRSKNAQSEAEYERAVDVFTRSCAGYCVATYVLGIGDRHNSNIMLNSSGFLFHIDFSRFLGNWQRFAGVRRDRAPFVCTPGFVYVMGGRESRRFKRTFVEYCCEAFQIFREHAPFFISLFSLMIPTGMSELKSEDDLVYLRNAFCLDKNDADAAAEFVSLIELSIKCKTTIINDTIHLFVHRKSEK